MKKILIGGCSFSQSTGFPNGINIPNWTSWSDFLDRDYSKNFNVINKAQSSFGQSRIVESLLQELIKYDFEIDYMFGVDKTYLSVRIYLYFHSMYIDHK